MPGFILNIIGIYLGIYFSFEKVIINNIRARNRRIGAEGQVEPERPKVSPAAGGVGPVASFQRTLSGR